MKKIIYLILLIFILSSCHGNLISETNQSQNYEFFDSFNSFDETKEYNITFWSKNDSNVYQMNIYNEAIKSFEKLYPNIHIKNQSYSDYQTIYNDVCNNIETNTLPNIAIGYPDHNATYLTGNNIIVPLDTLIDDENFGMGGKKLKFQSVDKSELIDKYIEEGKIDNHIFSLPFMRSSEACYVNLDYLAYLGYEEPDTLTWDFIFEVAKKALEKEPLNKIIIPMIYKSTDNMLIQLLYQNKIPYTSNKGEVYFTKDSKTKELLLKLQEYFTKGYFDTFKRVSYPGNSFNKGQCIFAIDSTAGATWMGPSCPNLDIKKEDAIHFKMKVYPVPQVDPNNPLMISQGPSLTLFNKEDKGEVLASWLFMNYLLTNDVQISYAKTEGYIPVTTSALNDPIYLDYLSKSSDTSEEYYSVKIDATKLLIDNYNHTFVTPVFNGSSKVRNASSYLVEQLYKKEYAGEEGINTLITKANALYHLDEVTENEFKFPWILVILGVVWIFILTYLIYSFIKKRKKLNIK